MSNPVSALKLLDPQTIDDPHAFYAELRAASPVWEIPDTGVFAVSSFELLAEVTSRVEDFSSNLSSLLYRGDDGLPRRFSFGDAAGQALATADPPAHGLHRKAVFPELVAKRMAGLEPDIATITYDCLTRAIGGATVDFMTAIGNVVPITMISRLIGFQNTDADQLMSAAFDSTAMLASTLTLDELMELVSRIEDTQKWISAELSDALADPAEDLLGAVARAVGNGVFTESEAAGVLHTLMSAGGESTTSLLGNAVRMLAEQPELQADLRAHPDRIPVFIEEALRLEPPFRHHMRSATRDTELGGTQIPAGATVLLLWGAGNRDPREFEQADSIDLQRDVPRHHLAFGRGIHHCVGAPLARLEARTVLTLLLERTSNITLDPEQPPTWVNSLMVRRQEQLPVRLFAA
jgi:cytochrome P450